MFYYILLLLLSSLSYVHSNPSEKEWIDDLAAVKVKAGYYKANRGLTKSNYLPDTELIAETTFDSITGRESEQYRLNLLFYNHEQEIPAKEQQIASYLKEELSLEAPKYFLLLQQKHANTQQIKQVILCPLSLAISLTEKTNKETKLSDLSTEELSKLIQQIFLKIEEKKLLEMGPAIPTKENAIAIHPHGRLYPLKR